MGKYLLVYKNEPWLIGFALSLMIIGVLVLNSIAANLFPLYFLYLAIGLLLFIVFSQISFSIFTLFSNHIYVLSVLLLLLPLAIGEVTRGAARWIQLGPVTIQPTELVRPFLILFYANLLASGKITIKKTLLAFLLLIIPIVIILFQPSLGVAILTFAGFAGVSFSLKYNKKFLLFTSLAFFAASPLFWLILAPYQKARILSLIYPIHDPSGAGYNSIQSMIAVGSGMLTGRGLGKGVQTQLAFLPERHTDFIFASIAEELGLLGAGLLILLIFLLLYRIIVVLENAISPVARAFAAGVFTTLLAQVVIHIGMNLGILPITGQPLPLVSAGGSSLIATTITLGLLMQAKKNYY